MSLRVLVLAGDADWIPSQTADAAVRCLAVDPAAVSETVAWVRAAKLAGADACVLVLPAHTESGEVVVATDHVNLTGNNPLVGPNLTSLGVRFPDMTTPYPVDDAFTPRAQSGVVVDFPEAPQADDLIALSNWDAQAATTGVSAPVIAGNHCGLRMGAILVPPGIDGSEVVHKVITTVSREP
ncbi:MAG: hypothetical protein HKN29_04285 [Rhodothermales bacterium]|nr:hypothetical protein [Rhodothermales bacterium]